MDHRAIYTRVMTRAEVEKLVAEFPMDSVPVIDFRLAGLPAFSK